jgi:hypothetical protein
MYGGVDTILTNSNKPWLVPIHGLTQVGQIKTCIQNKSGGVNNNKMIAKLQDLCNWHENVPPIVIE